MNNEKRQNFMKSFSAPYELPGKVWSPRQLKKALGRVVGGEKPKSDTFWFGGTVSVVGEMNNADNLSDLTETYPLLRVESEDESVGVSFLVENGSVRKYDELEPLSVLKDGDKVLIKSDWNSIRLTEGLMPDISFVTANDIKVASLNNSDVFSEEVWEYQRGRQWEYFQLLIRKCFAFLEFTEVRTPNLVPSPGTEPFIHPFETQVKRGSHTEKRYLPTSPEIHLKKLLAQGWKNIFELKTCFRNDEHSEHHQPEFLMLEWYRSYANIEAIERDVQGLINYMKLHWPENINGFGPLQKKTMADLFGEILNFEITPDTDLESYKKLAKENSIEVASDDAIDDVFFRIFTALVEPKLKPMGPVIVKKFPPFLSALARIDQDGWADRFEFYWKGLEIANAYFEVVDPEEQLLRYKTENEKRKSLGKPELPVDEEFIQALKRGVPPSAGIALGVDRLFMAICDLSTIEKTRPFSL